ncbi:MAG: hypothetical protein BEN19_06725 [Epulopiscium sp. Nuni2H_MBin003]|nr:MAG: hypothetical protein BEN19_06725 [Epulopiscium sp. Nuni2H_MBin003]
MKKIYIYGIGELCKRLYREFRNEHIVIKHGELIGFIVDEEYKTSDTFHGLPLLTPEEALKTEFNIILIAIDKHEPIRNKLISMGVDDKKILVDEKFTCVTKFLAEEFEEFVNTNKMHLNEVRNMLEDDFSKETFDNILEFRKTGNITFREKTFDPNEYFPKDIFNLEDNWVYIDAGTYGIDPLEYGSITNQIKETNYKKIIFFEPNLTVIPDLLASIKNQNLRDIQVECKGIYDKTDIVGFDAMGPSSSITSIGNNYILVDTIDNVLKGEQIDYIKMDVEGAELKGLIGAKNSIQKYKPILVISIYHKFEDWIDLPKYIKELNPNYSLYLRHHGITEYFETILYAIDRKR